MIYLKGATFPKLFVRLNKRTNQLLVKQNQGRYNI